MTNVSVEKELLALERRYWSAIKERCSRRQLPQPGYAMMAAGSVCCTPNRSQVIRSGATGSRVSRIDQRNRSFIRHPRSAESYRAGAVTTRDRPG